MTNVPYDSAEPQNRRFALASTGAPRWQSGPDFAGAIDSADFPGQESKPEIFQNKRPNGKVPHLIQNRSYALLVLA